MTAVVATSRAFDAVLVVHVLVAVWALVVLVVLRAAALAAGSSEPMPPSAQRTFAANREVAGRVVHLVPATGLVLLSLSRGAYDLATPFVDAGLSLWALAAVALEGFAFPARRRVARALAGASDPRGPARVLRQATELAALAILAAGVAMVAGGL